MQPGYEKFRKYLASLRGSKKLPMQDLTEVQNRSVPWYVRISKAWHNAAIDDFFGSRMRVLKFTIVTLLALLPLEGLSFDIPPQNKSKPEINEIKSFRQRAQEIVQAIQNNDAKSIIPYFFPGQAFEALKDMKHSSAYYKKLVKWYKDDIEREHARFKGQAIAFKDVKMGRCKWKDVGTEYNKIPYWSCYRNKIVVSSGNKDHDIQLRAIINWGDQWYVTHLGPVPKE